MKSKQGPQQAMQLDQKDDITILNLPATVTVSQGEALKAALGEALAAGRPLTVDASAVTQIDTAACQLLLAGSQAFDEAGKQFSLTDASEPAQKALTRLGLIAHLPGAREPVDD